MTYLKVLLLTIISMSLSLSGCKKRVDIPSQTKEFDHVTVSHTREFRGAWIATVENIDWPSKAGLSVDEQKKEMRHILDQLKLYRINAALFQARPEGDAMYPSKHEPWSRFLSGTQGQDPGYDPLAFFLEEAHNRGIEAHVWLNPYRAKANKASAVVAPHAAVTAKEYVYEYRNLAWMDPGAQVIEDKTYNVVMDMVERYDIDGVHIDDYFYPYPDQTPFPDDKTYADYQKKGGTLARDDWRRDNVNRLMKRIYTGIKSHKPYVEFGISPFGIYRPGQPEGVKGLDQYNALYADPKKWVEEKWVDYIAPQLYWAIASKDQPYEKLLDWWSNLSSERYTYGGHSTTHVAVEGDAYWPPEEIIEQTKITRKYRKQNALGDIFFSAKNVFNNTKGLGEKMSALYERPALTPPINWDKKAAPTPPQVAKSEKGISVGHPQKDTLRWYVIYKEDQNVWVVEGIYPSSATEIPLATGRFVVTAIDKHQEESLGVSIDRP